MTLQVVRAWYNRLPPTERDLPILMLDGIAYTPNMVLAEVTRGSIIGYRLQRLIEEGRLGTSRLEEEQLAKIRLRELLRRYPERPLVATLREGRTFTPSQLIDEIERGTPVGRMLIFSELEYMRFLLRLR
jgi:hypothetical protein